MCLPHKLALLGTSDERFGQVLLQQLTYFIKSYLTILFNLDRFQDIVSLFHEPHFRLSVSLLYLFQFQHMSPLGIGQRVWSTSHSVMLESVKGVMLLEPGNEVDVTYAAHQ